MIEFKSAKRALAVAVGLVFVLLAGGANAGVDQADREQELRILHADNNLPKSTVNARNKEIAALKAELAELKTEVARLKAGTAQSQAAKSELARLRAENAQLNAKIAKTETAQTAQPTASSPVPKGVTVSGAAYVVRQSGQSDILRGFRVTVIQRTVPEKVYRKALTAVVQKYKNRVAELRKKAADGKEFGQKPQKSYFWEQIKEVERKEQMYSRLLANVSGPVDSVDALKLIDKANEESLTGRPIENRELELLSVKKAYLDDRITKLNSEIQEALLADKRVTGDSEHVLRDLVDSIRIVSTTTDRKGAYKFTDAPTNAYIFAMFDTADGFMLWAIPVQGSGSKDLFNDTALILR